MIEQSLLPRLLHPTDGRPFPETGRDYRPILVTYHSGLETVYIYFEFR